MTKQKEEFIIVKDPAIEPFFITTSKHGGFAISEVIKKGDNRREYVRTLAYPSTFDSALKIISQELVKRSEKKEYSSIQEFIEEYRDIAKKLSHISGIDVGY